MSIKRLLKHDNTPILLVFLGMIIIVFFVELFGVRDGDLSRVAFVRPMNVSNVLMQVAITGILAIGMTLIMISGGIDLSVGQMVSFTGTPVGCACGEGVVDWERVAGILKPVDREIFLSVECGTIDQAERSRTFLEKTLGKYLA